jgi:hypothetical protein
MGYPNNVLIETVLERRGDKMIPVFPEGERKVNANGQKMKPDMFRKVPNMIPVGVFVGVRVGKVIFTGWSRCKVMPAQMQALANLPIEVQKLLRHEIQEELRDCESDCNVFDRERGIGEAFKSMLLPKPVPCGRGFGTKFDIFKRRCTYYFKEATHMMVNGVPTLLVKEQKKQEQIVSLQSMASMDKDLQKIFGAITAILGGDITLKPIIMEFSEWGTLPDFGKNLR